MLTPQAWHRRFSQQARWTEEIRRFVVQKAGLGQAHCVLEAGCGTGAILGSMQHLMPTARFIGIDLRVDYLQEGQQIAPQSHLSAADAAALPFPDGCFDAAICHYFLLWVKSPEAILAEMKRVARPGGIIVALAEPDYGGRIDYPAALAELGRMQAQALQIQGADPLMGRKLSSLFHQAGLTDIQTGVMGGQWNETPAFEAWESEWAVLQADLGHTIPAEKLNWLRSLDGASWQKGDRILFVPTFYAWGRV